MCLMCIEIANDRMSIKEARHALKELRATAKNEDEMSHYRDLSFLSDDELYHQAKENSEDPNQSA